MSQDLKWYVDYFAKELAFSHSNNFTGSLNFQVNFRSGNVGNMNIGINQSVKMEGMVDDQFSKTVKKT